jgi:tetratricopeptide (TPR) repeat protein
VARSKGPWLAGGAFAAVGLVSLLAYAPTYRAGFLQDDHPIVEINPVVRRGNPVEIFSTDWWGGVRGGDTGLYRPLTMLTFSLQRGADGAVDPARAHRANAVLNIVAGGALLLLARRCGARSGVALVAGSLFVLHPLHTSAVAGLVGRAEILACLFTLAALLVHSRSGPWAEPSATRGRVANSAAAALGGLFVFCALCSKESAIAVLPLLVLLELTIRPRPKRYVAELGAVIGRLAPAATATFVYLALRARALGGPWVSQKVLLADNPLVALHGSERAATALGLVARAARSMLFPVGLSPDYSGNVIEAEISWLAPRPLAGLFVLILAQIALAAPWLPMRRRFDDSLPPRNLTSLASALFLFPYLIVGNLLVLVGVVYAERLLYLPSAGFCLGAALASAALLRLVPARPVSRLAGGDTRTALGSALALLLLLTLAVGTWSSSHDWSSNERLWEAAVRASPRSPRAQFTLGKIRADQGRDDEALPLFERAIELWPYFSSAWYEKARILTRRGNLAAAEEAYRKSCALNPNHEGTWIELAALLRRQGRLQDAAAVLREAAGHLPDSARIAGDLADTLLAAGRRSEAAAAYERAIRLGREDLRPRLRQALPDLPRESPR